MPVAKLFLRFRFGKLLCQFARNTERCMFDFHNLWRKTDCSVTSQDAIHCMGNGIRVERVSVSGIVHFPGVFPLYVRSTVWKIADRMLEVARRCIRFIHFRHESLLPSWFSTATLRKSNIYLQVVILLTKQQRGTRFFFLWCSRNQRQDECRNGKVLSAIYT